MFRYIYNTYFNPKYRMALRDTNGKSIYAGYCMDAVENKTSKKGSRIRESIKALTQKKKDFRNLLNEILKHPILENDEYYSLRKKIRMQQFLFWILVIAEFGLNYFTTLIFLSQKGAGWFALRIVIAITFTVVGVIASEKFLEEAMPKKPKDDVAAKKKFNFPLFAFWLIVLILFEVVIYNLGLVRGHDFESGSVGGDVARALVLASMIIPIVAGGVRWDLLNYIDIYKNRRNHDKFMRKINTIDTKLELLSEKENTYFQRECSDYWHTLSVFCTHKNSFNLKNNMEQETLENHKFGKNIDSFKVEAEKRYRAKIKKTDFERVATKLDNLDVSTGKKLGQ